MHLHCVPTVTHRFNFIMMIHCVSIQTLGLHVWVKFYVLVNGKYLWLCSNHSISVIYCTSSHYTGTICQRNLSKSELQWIKNTLDWRCIVFTIVEYSSAPSLIGSVYINRNKVAMSKSRLRIPEYVSLVSWFLTSYLYISICTILVNLHCQNISFCEE